MVLKRPRQLGVVLVGASLLAFQPAPIGAGQEASAREGVQVRPGERVRVIGGATSVMGFVWQATNDPLPNVEVQLRNLLSGSVEARTRTSDAGEFLFRDVEGGTYVVEIVNERGTVVALGAPFTVAPGETIATFVRLAPAAPWFTNVMTNTAVVAVAAAAGLGIVALKPPGQAASADR